MMNGRTLNFLTLCHQHTTQVSIWLCMCERVCERVSGWQASQYPSSRVCVKGCDLLGKEDSGSGPCQTEYPPSAIHSPGDHYQWGPSLSLCLVLHWLCVNTSSPSNTPALHRKWEITRRERGTSYTLGGRREGGRALGHVWTWHTHIHTHTRVVVVPQRFSLNPTLLCSDIFVSAVKRSPAERVNFR